MVASKIYKERPAQIAASQLADPLWRLSNLYWIQNKEGRTVQFRPNAAQEKFRDNLHTRNLILKARQLGFSTFIDIFLLDCALFTPGFHAGIVADTEDTAQDLFRTKIQFPYEHLPPSMQEAVNIVTANKSQYEFTNGSVIETGVTLRSGTCQGLHVSEFGKISVEHPDRADEVVSGSLETVPIDGITFIESTARGRSGRFYDYFKQAEKNELGVLTDLDYKLHFYPWFCMPEYILDPTDVVVPAKMSEYFKNLGVKLSASQMAWYVKKEESLGDKMKREYPSTAKEAFELSSEGAYFGKEMMDVRKAGRIGSFPVLPDVNVDTHWDLGSANMAIVFTQKVGDHVRCVDYFEGAGAGFPSCAKMLRERGYKYGIHNAPHDINTLELSGKTRIEIAAASGIRFTLVPRIQDKDDAIELARNAFKHCSFDAAKCAALITHLEEYRRDWDALLGEWKSIPAKSEHNHGADAFMTMAQGTDIPLPDPEPGVTPEAWQSKRRKF